MKRVCVSPHLLDDLRVGDSREQAYRQIRIRGKLSGNVEKKKNFFIFFFSYFNSVTLVYLLILR